MLNNVAPYPTAVPPPEVNYKTCSKLSNITVQLNAITTIIHKLNIKKAHGYDNISIAMLKLCSPEVSVPLKIIFDKCIQSGSFPSSWKVANVQPVHKKGSRQCKEQYRPISLLPVCSKILEKIIFDQLYSYLVSNHLISENQSGFRPGDSTINQLLSITTSIYESFENYEETRAVFLDISKAFDKVWQQNAISMATTEDASKIFESSAQKL